MNLSYQNTESANKRDIAHFFEYSSQGVQVEADGLQELTFGEFLVEQGALARKDLLRALQLQDKHPGTRIGECIAALGILPYPRIEQYLRVWNSMEVIEV
jgi:hypothetical protein